MDDHTIAPANDSEPSTATQDHKAHNEIEPPQYGRLGHLAYQPDQSHLHNSYWKFQSIDDDRRAAAHGFTTPEELLVVADNSDEKHNDIKIVWTGIAGDPGSRSAIIGTASQHLQTIYELRNLLGLPMSLREQVPLYPTSTDVCLKQYWERKHGEQLPVRTVQAPQAAGQQELLTKTSNPRLANQSCLVSNMSSIQVTSDPTAVGTYNAERTQVSLPLLAKPASLQSCSSAMEILTKQPVPTYRMFERSATFQNSDEVAQQQESFSTTATFSATDTWSHSELESMTKLPCIDCGGNDDHASGCHIGSEYPLA